MALTPGTRLGVYDITAQIGVGGMGEVYQATDTNLKRSVAIKVLPASVAGDADRLARFQREAEVLAALNHPNIAAIYGLVEGPAEAGHHIGTDVASGFSRTSALVMELVEGDDLSQRIARGAIPIDEALPMAKQIAEALEAAHEQGIIHRDLKPANIKVRSDGTVKVLDFGLAKALDEPKGSSPQGLENSPTITSPAMTQAGMILGTAAYMAPEQARGKTVDRRADVWAFGAVLYEMLTSRRAFPGDDITDTIVSVVSKEPDWRALPAATPAGVRRLLARCLKKDPKARMRDIGEARLQLEELVSGAPEEMSATVVAPAARAPRPLWKRAAPAIVTGVVAAAIVGATAWALWPAPPSLPVTRFTFTLGEGQQLSATSSRFLAVSPDGRSLAYVANSQLYLRSMSDLEARPLPGTQMTATPATPVFSPDGRSIAFSSLADGTIKKIAVTGGAAITICPAELPLMGMSWDGDGIVFGQGSKGILRVSANGGQPAVIAAVEAGELAHGPQVLPGGEWVLFTVATSATAEGWDKAQIVVQSLKTSERRTLITGGSDARYVATGLGSPKRGLFEGGLAPLKRSERESGHLVYALGGVLFAVPFDLRQLAVTGGPVPVIEGVRRASAGRVGTAQLSISNTGSLVFSPGPVTSSGGSDLALIDRTGTAQPLKLPPNAYEYPRVSPDGKRIAVGSDDGKEAIVWVYDVSGATAIRRLTVGGRNRVPVWSADGEHVAFQSDREGDLGIFWQRADGTSAAERLTKPDDKDTAHVPESWSPDGKTLLFSVAKGGSYLLAALSLPDKKMTLFGGVQSTTPPAATFSPDGKWVAYSEGGPGVPGGALFVQPFPATGATYPISKGIGYHPTWAPDGRELFYAPTIATFVAVGVTTKPAFTFGNPAPVVKAFLERGSALERNNDITRDGKYFLGVVAAGTTTTSGGATPQIQVVLNWFEELKARVPTK